MTQALITKNAKMFADNIIVGIEDMTLRKRLFVYAHVLESLVDFFENQSLSATTKISLYKNVSISTKFDIADIYIKNLRADVRIADDSTSAILIPKQHKELGIEPDIYLIVKVDSDFNSYEVTGFIPTEDLVFDKEIQDYYILSPKKVLTIDKLRIILPNIKVKKYTTNLNEKDILQLFLRNEEEDISLNSQKALLHCLLANNSFIKKMNTINKMNFQAKGIKNYPQLLEDIKPNIEEELAEEVQEVEIDTMPELTEIIDDNATFEEILEELHPEEFRKEKEEELSELEKFKEIEALERLEDLKRLEEMGEDFHIPQKENRKKKPLFLHVVVMILAGVLLLMFGVFNKNKKIDDEPQEKTNVVNNAIIPTQSIEIKKLSWGISTELAKNKEFIEYLNDVGTQAKDALSDRFLSLIEVPTKKEVRIAIIFDNEGNYSTNSIIKSSGSKEVDKIVTEELSNILLITPTKKFKASAPFIRAILIIKL